MVKCWTSDAAPQYARSVVSSLVSHCFGFCSWHLTVSRVLDDIVLCDVAPGFALEPQVIAHDLRAVRPACCIKGFFIVVVELVGT